MSFLVTNVAPDFHATAVMPDNSINANFCLSEYLKGKMGLLFFYPLNFTFVCPSEILAFNEKYQEFKDAGIELVAVSIDSQYSHIAYKEKDIKQGGIGKVQFPMVSDIKKEISEAYGVLFNNSIALRGAFLIDEDFKVRHATINDLPLGRNVDEFLRLGMAVRHHKEHGEVCPANWTKGQAAMKPTQEGVANYLSKTYAK